MAVDVFGIVGTVIAGAYRVEKVVAEGGFGVVYRAHHGGFRAPVALKCLKVPQHQDDELRATFLEQFRAEAELMFRLSASLGTIVRPLHIDAMTTPDGSFVPFMVLEWLEGETLDEIIRGRTRAGLPPLRLPELMRLLTPVARALEKAHHFAGPSGPVCVVHRDLKPENIFVARVAGEEVVKILDFGIGKVKSVANQVAGRASHGAGGVTSFTPAYGAPEQWVPRKLGQTGPWTDVWGLALTMVEALHGSPVIDGDHQAIMGTVLDPVRRPTPRQEGIAVDDRVEAIFAKALAVDPRERYSSARQFWSDLVLALGLGDEQAIPSTPSTPSTPGASAPVSVRGGASSPSAARTSSADAFAIPDLELGGARRPSAAGFASPVMASGTPSHAPRELEAAEEDTGIELALDLPDLEPPRARIPSQASLPPSVRSSPRVSSPSLPSSPVPAGPGLASSPPSTPRAPAQPSSPPGAGPAQSSPRGIQRSRPDAGGDASSLPAGPLQHSFPRPVPGVARALPGEQPLLRKVLPGAALIGASVVITVADQIYSAAAGEIFELGPLRATWIAALLLFAGLGLVVYRALPRQ